MKKPYAYLISNGSSTLVNIMKMYVDFGPYCLAKSNNSYPDVLHRLDGLKDITLINDMSTKKSNTTSSGSIETNTGSLIVRSAIGAIVFGPAGTIIGGVTGKKTTSDNSFTTETHDLNILIKVTLSDDKNVMIRFDDYKSFEFFTSFIGSETWSQEKVDNAEMYFSKSLEKSKDELNKKNTLSDIYKSQLKELGLSNYDEKKSISFYIAGAIMILFSLFFLKHGISAFFYGAALSFISWFLINYSLVLYSKHKLYSLRDNIIKSCTIRASNSGFTDSEIYFQKIDFPFVPAFIMLIVNGVIYLFLTLLLVVFFAYLAR